MIHVSLWINDAKTLTSIFVSVDEKRKKIFTSVPTAEVTDAHTITRLHEATLYLAICKNCMYIKCCRTCLEVVYLPEIELPGNTPIGNNTTNRCYVLYLTERG